VIQPEDLLYELKRAGGCAHPIRLRGWHERIDAETGELLARVVTAREPGRVLLIACGDRRAASCPACSELYAHDAFQLVAAGLRGGKGMPESVSGHPAVMLTLTAPSFGRVHTIRDRDGGCPCGSRHAPNEEVLGTPIDPASYDYAAQAAWNHLASALWKRTAQAIRRGLARELGVPRGRLRDVVQVRFLKVAEFQRRGVVHYHVVIRLDGPGDEGSEPPSRCSVDLLERVVSSVVREVRLPVQVPGNEERAIRWGKESDVVGLRAGDTSAAAGYIAKYATKSTESVAGGRLIPRVRSAAEIQDLQVARHAQRLVEAAWRLGAFRGLAGARRWAHQFGYGGHVLTKSRGYSITFGALREARVAWRAGRAPTAAIITRGRLAYAGRGYRDPSVARLADAWHTGGLVPRSRSRKDEGADGTSI
jgi:hypothetical protein